MVAKGFGKEEPWMNLIVRVESFNSAFDAIPIGRDRRPRLDWAPLVIYTTSFGNDKMD